MGLQVRAGQVRGPGVDGRHLRDRVHIPGVRVHPQVLPVAGENTIYLFFKKVGNLVMFSDRVLRVGPLRGGLVPGLVLPGD